MIVWQVLYFIEFAFLFEIRVWNLIEDTRVNSVTIKLYSNIQEFTFLKRAQLPVRISTTFSERIFMKLFEKFYWRHEKEWERERKDLILMCSRLRSCSCNPRIYVYLIFDGIHIKIYIYKLECEFEWQISLASKHVPICSKLYYPLTSRE